MTDNEIIKALERCPQHRECCYCNSVEECGNKRVLTTSVIELIDRKDAEIEALYKTLDKQILENHSQKEEIKSLREYNKSIRYCYEQAKSYNDKLAESCETNCKKFNMTTRAEAIKEFAERVKQEINFPLAVWKVFDNLVKEMIGGD